MTGKYRDPGLVWEPRILTMTPPCCLTDALGTISLLVLMHLFISFKLLSLQKTETVFWFIWPRRWVGCAWHTTRQAVKHLLKWIRNSFISAPNVIFSFFPWYLSYRLSFFSYHPGINKKQELHCPRWERARGQGELPGRSYFSALFKLLHLLGKHFPTELEHQPGFSHFNSWLF